MNLEDNLDDLEYGQMYPSVVMDTQIYPGVISGGGYDSDSDFELGPSLDDPESDGSSSESDADDDKPLIVRVPKIEGVTHGGDPTSSGQKKMVSFVDAAREFVSFLGKVKLPV